jgi:hypothetical protein
MEPIFTCSETGQLQVLVNPVTGRVYGFAPAGGPIQTVSDEQTQVVYVDAQAQQFAEQMMQGLFYRSGAFYRSMQPQSMNLLAVVGEPVIVRCQLPQPIVERAQAYVYDEQGALLQQAQLISDSNGVFEYHVQLPNVGKYKVVIETEQFGRSSAYVYVQPKVENKVVRSLKSGDIRGALAAMPTLSQGLMTDIQGLSPDALLKSLNNELEAIPEPLRSKIKKQIEQSGGKWPTDLLGG